MMNRPPKMKKLYKEYFKQHLMTSPGYRLAFSEETHQLDWIKAIKAGAYDFITDHAGPVIAEITNDANLNSELTDLFAQTFIKHFWNYRIGYKRAEDFYINLSSFLNEQLPLWSEFFNEAVVKGGGFYTNTGQVFVTDDGQLKYESTNTTTSEGNTTQTGKNLTDTNEQGNSNSSNQSKGTSSVDDTQGTQGENHETSKQNALNLEATTPQDRINYDQEKLTSGDYEGVYDFTYADKVASSHQQGSNDTTTNTTTNGHQEGTTTDTTTGSTTSTNHNTTTTTNDGKTTTNNSENATGSHQQTDNRTQSTTTQSRNADVFQIAEGLNHFANGAYLNLFKNAKAAGLFLLTYY